MGSDSATPGQARNTGLERVKGIVTPKIWKDLARVITFGFWV